VPIVIVSECREINISPCKQVILPLLSSSHLSLTLMPIRVKLSPSLITHLKRGPENIFLEHILDVVKACLTVMVFQLNYDDLIGGCLSDVENLVLVVIHKSKDLIHVQGLNV
jgi:hypothetical protein